MTSFPKCSYNQFYTGGVNLKYGILRKCYTQHIQKYVFVLLKMTPTRFSIYTESVCNDFEMHSSFNFLTT